MGEKRGDTGKLEIDFDSSGCLEVFMKGQWFRTTSREFRSFDGKRRITLPIETKLGEVEVKTETRDYYGPVYMWGTNNAIKPTGSGKIISSSLRENFLNIEKRFYD